jgi:hypothetical protein
MTHRSGDIVGDDGEPEEAPDDDKDGRFQAARTTTGKAIKARKLKQLYY